MENTVISNKKKPYHKKSNSKKPVLKIGNFKTSKLYVYLHLMWHFTRKKESGKVNERESITSIRIMGSVNYW